MSGKIEVDSEVVNIPCKFDLSRLRYKEKKGVARYT